MHTVRHDEHDMLSLTYAGRAFTQEVPRYQMPAESMLRMVVKENFSRDRVRLLVGDLRAALEGLRSGRPWAQAARQRRRPHC